MFNKSLSVKKTFTLIFSIFTSELHLRILKQNALNKILAYANSQLQNTLKGTNIFFNSDLFINHAIKLRIDAIEYKL